jgi:hypothetical protein
MAKWNEALRIEEALGADAHFAGRTALPLGTVGAVLELPKRPPSPDRKRE